MLSAHIAFCIAPVSDQKASRPPMLSTVIAVLGHVLQAALEQAACLARDDPMQLPDHGRDRVRARDEAEDPDRDHQRRRNRQEGVVGKRGGDVRHVVGAELLDRPPQDREVVAFGLATTPSSSCSQTASHSASP